MEVSQLLIMLHSFKEKQERCICPASSTVSWPAVCPACLHRLAYQQGVAPHMHEHVDKPLTCMAMCRMP